MSTVCNVLFLIAKRAVIYEHGITTLVRGHSRIALPSSSCIVWVNS